MSGCHLVRVEDQRLWVLAAAVHRGLEVRESEVSNHVEERERERERERRIG